jgi:MFS family permease
MAETDTDPADQFDARVSPEPLDERAPGLFRRYRRLPAKRPRHQSRQSAQRCFERDHLSASASLSFAFARRVSGHRRSHRRRGESISSFLKLFAGYFSDRTGKRKTLVVSGYALAGLARPLLGFATSWPQVFAVRFADRIGKGIRSAPRDAMIADSASPSERGLAFGFHRAMDHMGAVVGPLIGYVLLIMFAADADAPTQGEYKLIFLAASVPALAAVLVAAFAIRETSTKQSGEAKQLAAATAAPAAAPPSFSLRGFDGNFKRFLVILALFTLSNSSDAFLLLRAREAGISTQTIPLLWAALHASKVISSLVGGDLSDRLGRKTLIVAGWLFYAAVYAGFAFVSTAGGAWALFLVYGIYFGLAEGAEKALVADLVPADRRGTAYGLYNLAFSLTVWPASLLMGALWSWRGAQTAFLASAVVGALAALLLAFTIRSQRSQNTGVRIEKSE